MTWNYRVVHTEECYEVREVYYDNEGNIILHSIDAMAPFGESLADLRSDLERFIAALRQPVLEESDLPKQP